MTAPDRTQLGTWVMIAGAAAGGVASAAEPAGWLPADIVFRAGFAALIAFAAARAHPWTWVVLAGAAAGAGADGWLVVPAALAVVTALAGYAITAHRPVVGAAVGALSVQVLLRLDLEEPGLATLVVAVAVTPVLVSAWLRWSKRSRRVAGLTALAVTGLAVMAALGLAYASVRAQGEVQAAADGVRDGLDALRDNRPQDAVALLNEAADDFDRANRAVATWGLPARAVPVLGHQARAAVVLTEEGRALATTAARAATDADTDELRFDDGAIDLDLVAGFEAPLEDAYEALTVAADHVAEARTLWLVDPLSTGLADFAAEVDQALPEARLAIDGVRLAPALFGGEGERHYYIAFTQPAEARGLSGFVGNFGELTARDGNLELTRSGRIRELNTAPGALQRQISGPADYLRRYGRFRPAQFLQDVTFSPDGPSVGRVMAELYPQAGGVEVDGVIIVDPVALAALMEFTGPIAVEGLDEPLTAENAADFLIREQYLTFQDRPERIDFLDEASEVTFERLTAGDLPGPRRVGEVLGPVARQGRLIVYSTRPEEQALLERIGVDGTFPPVADGDFVALTTQNGANNKIDIFLERSVDYEARWDPGTGAIDATATVTLRNTAPVTGLPGAVIGSSDTANLPYGTNVSYLSLYSPHRLVSAAAGGLPLDVQPQRERGRWVYSRYVQLAAGEAVTLTFRLQGAIPPGADYHLTHAPQPTVQPDRVRLAVTVEGPWDATGAQGWTLGPEGAETRFPAEEDRRFTLQASGG